MKGETMATTVATKPSSEDLVRKTIARRAVEAVIWGMPAVNTELMKQEMLTKTPGKVNQVLYWSQPADAKNQTLTPNPDAIYVMAFFDTKDAGPIVFDIPPADSGSFAGSIVDVWQMPLEDVGPAGADRGAGGKYLVLPPDYKGAAPAGYIVLKCNTYSGYGLLRSNLLSHSDADIATSVAYGKRVKIYPLSQSAHAPETPFADAAGIMFDSTIRYDPSYFKTLDAIVQREPWIERDRVMIDHLKSIGIEKGTPFNPDEAMQGILRAAIAEARAWLEQKYETSFAPYWPGARWAVPVSADVRDAYTSSYGNPNAYPVDDRGVAYTYAFIGIKRLGAAQFYLMTIKDRDNQPFDGGKMYQLHVPPHAPAKQYWSATVYDREKHTVLDTAHASRSSNGGVQQNADGSTDLYFGPRAPSGKAANWVPTIGGRQFEVLFRLYAPDKPLFDKTWTLPDIEIVK
jgi:hypothetical protein